MFFLPVLLYAGFVVAVLRVHSRPKTFSAYSINCRSSGLWSTVWSYFVTGESAWLILALAACGYTMGAQAFWIVVSESLFIWIAWRWTSKWYQETAQRNEARTIVDLLASKVTGDAGVFRIAASLVLFLVIPSYVSAQLVGIAKVFRVFFVDQTTFLVPVIFAVLLLSATFTSFQAMARLHLVQGPLRVVGLFLLLAVCVQAAWGQDWNEFWSSQHIQSNRNSVPDMSVLQIVGFFIVAFDFLGMPQLSLRFAAAQDSATIRKGMLPILTIHFLSLSSAVLTGMLARLFLPDLVDAELLVPLLAKEAGPVIGGIIFTAILATIMSTVDQLLHLVGSSLSWDIYRSLLDSRVQDKALIRLSRVSVALVGLVALLLAQLEIQIIGLIVRYACSALASAFGPLMIWCVAGKRVASWSAATAVVSGFIVTLLIGRILVPPAGLEIAAGCSTSLFTMLVAERLRRA